MKRKNNPTIERIRSIPLFAACTRDELVLISGHISEHHATAGDVLIREGGPAREFVVIVEGTADVVVNGRSVARLGPGDFVGEVGLLDGGRRTATVVASTDVVAEISTAAEFAAMLAGAPTLSQTLLIGLARRLRSTDLQLSA